MDSIEIFAPLPPNPRELVGLFWLGATVENQELISFLEESFRQYVTRLEMCIAACERDVFEPSRVVLGDLKGLSFADNFPVLEPAVEQTLKQLGLKEKDFGICWGMIIKGLERRHEAYLSDLESGYTGYLLLSLLWQIENDQVDSRLYMFIKNNLEGTDFILSAHEMKQFSYTTFIEAARLIEDPDFLDQNFGDLCDLFEAQPPSGEPCFTEARVRGAIERCAFQFNSLEPRYNTATEKLRILYRRGINRCFLECP
jgi:hypothetical protein